MNIKENSLLPLSGSEVFEETSDAQHGFQYHDGYCQSIHSLV
jgi:hypothetical protein